MKKLFYVVLVIVILMVISYFVKGGNQKELTSPEAVSVVNVEETATSDVSDSTVDAAACNCDVKAEECICPENQPDCDCASQKTSCNCKTSDGLEVTEEVDENIEEVNPDVTANDDETIIQE